VSARCGRCSRRLARGATCSCAVARTARSFAQTLRTRAAAVPAPTADRRHRIFDPFTGQVRREQDAVLGGAWGTRAVTLASLAVPLIGASALGSDVAAGLVPALAVLLMPLFLLLVLMSLGRGGALGFLGRFTSNAVRAGASIGAARATGARGFGRLLIVSGPGGEARVCVARALDVPVGSMVTVYGPRAGGYRHAWFVRVDGLDSSFLATRGVWPALLSVGLGGLLIVAALVGAAG
jgi:hypothetical protein